MTDINDGANGSDRFDYIEGLLSTYPAVSDDQLEDLKLWFKKEASAFDVASLASKETSREGYDKFRADHLDRLTMRDAATTAFVTLIVIALIAAMAWFAPH